MRTPPQSPSRDEGVVEHSGRPWSMDVASIHATNFRVDGGGSGRGGGGESDGSYVVYDIEVVPGGVAAASDGQIERVHKRWSQVEALHAELVEELPSLAWREITFPKKWVKTLDEEDIAKRLRDMNEYFFALIQLCTRARRTLRPSTAFGRFLTEPSSHRGDEARHTPQQLADVRAQDESDAFDAAALKAEAMKAADRIVKADIRKAQQRGLDYHTFRSQYRPVGGDASLHKLWEEAAVGNPSPAKGKAVAADAGGWEPLDLSLPPLPCDVMDGSAHKTAVVSVHVNDLLSVDVVGAVFTPLVSFTLDWTDDGAIEWNSAGSGWALKVDEDEIWRPFMDFENLVEKADSLDDTIGVYTQGGRPIVNQFRRHINVLRPRKMDLAAFPFDTVELDIVLSFGWTSNELQVVPGPVDVSEAVHSSSEYVLTGRRVNVTDQRYSYFERYDASASYPHMTVTLELTRKPLYYMRLVLTLLAVTCMEITSFLLPATDLSDRFGVSGTVVLAAIGFHYMAAEHLPKLAYLTRLDYYIIWCYILIFGSFVENIVAFSAAQSFPGGDKATSNSALMECYASWFRLACDSGTTFTKAFF